MATQKKAKLAHEKKSVGGSSDSIRFNIQKVFEIVDYPSGKQSAFVDLDGKSSFALVSTIFTSKEDNKLVPSVLACPAVYDKAAKERAMSLYSEYAATKEQVSGGENELQQ